MSWIVELQPGCWLATWSGDPGRTLIKTSARRYATERGARIALGIARRIRPGYFLNAKVEQIAQEEVQG